MFKQLKPRRRLTVRTLLSVFLQCAEWHRSAGRAGDLNAPSPFFLPFLFFDTRRQICSKSLSQFEALTLQSHTHAHTPKKAHTPQLHRWWCGGWGGTHTDTRWDLFPSAHRWRCEACVFCAEKYARRCGFWGTLHIFFFAVHLFICLDPGWGVLGGNNKQWITQCAYFYSCQAFRLCRSEPDSQQLRCEYSFRNSLLAFHKKSWIIRCVWLFFFFSSFHTHPRSDVPWNTDVIFNMSTYDLYSVYIAVGETLSPARLSVSFSAKWWWLHITSDAASPCETGSLKLLFPCCCQPAAGGCVSCCHRNPDSSSEFGSGASKLFPVAFHTHQIRWALEFFPIGEFCTQALFIYLFITVEDRIVDAESAGELSEQVLLSSGWFCPKGSHDQFIVQGALCNLRKKPWSSVTDIFFPKQTK